MEKKLPIFNLEITSDLEDDVEVDVVSLVDRPAIERSFLMFKDDKFIDPIIGEGKDKFLPRCIEYVINEGKETEQAVAICNSIWDEHFAVKELKQNFAIQSEEERIISGPLMLADTPIYRNDDNGEYYVVFTKETIKKIAQRFFKKGYQSNVNLMHDQGNLTDGLTMFESWLKDDKRGIKAMKGFEDVPDGSWFVSFKVDNDEVWEMVKAGKVRGFSVEGQFNYRKTGDKRIEQLWENVLGVLAQIG
ncbi:Phage-like element PBSX protein, XkdF [uncultured Caudovirales phage]|uniref:Phage-like element PBSX protein, XkdF n=1 Tax=uncultured Caudovirales phage TaxID=2100421 RepID=A0A6J5LWL1_9CAUD|nr:Phage-like element PBSX protein, XkdF [uncultured Caudovirales phage]